MVKIVFAAIATLPQTISEVAVEAGRPTSGTRCQQQHLSVADFVRSVASFLRSVTNRLQIRS